MAEGTKRAQDEPAPGEGMVQLRFLVPTSWHSALTELARRQRISLADVCRIMVRGFMRERLTEAQRRELEVD